MRHIQYFVLDVFTHRPLSGNPLAVFPDRELLSEDELQRIARELNLSETVFVEPSNEPEAVRRLRIFTPQKEIPLAGHPVVGAWHLLASEGLVDFEEEASIGRAVITSGGDETTQIAFKHELGAGVLPVTVYRTGDEITGVLMEQAKPKFSEEVEDISLVAKALGLGESAVGSSGLLPRVVNTGLNILIVPVANRIELSVVKLDSHCFDKLCRKTGALGIYAFTTAAQSDWAFARARGFFPGTGVPEDPATGSAAGCLGAYLAKHGQIQCSPSSAFQIEQGNDMGRPSRIGVEVTCEGDEVLNVRVLGSSVIIARAELILPG